MLQLLLLRVLDHLLEVRVLLGQLLHHVLQPLTYLALRGQDPLPPTTVALAVLINKYSIDRLDVMNNIQRIINKAVKKDLARAIAAF